MKKLLATAIAIVTLSFAAISAEAKTPAPKFKPAPQERGQRGRHGGRDWNNDRRFNHPVRTFTETVYSRIGRRFFRDTYLTTVFRNGRTERRLISRMRVR